MAQKIAFIKIGMKTEQNNQDKNRHQENNNEDRTQPWEVKHYLFLYVI